MIDFIKKHLSYADTRNFDIDDPLVTILRRKILKEKRFLHRIYLDWYTLILNAFSEDNKPVLEVGSGAGFFSEISLSAITSEVFFLHGVSAILDSQFLPLASSSLGAIVMIDVFHHIPNPRNLLIEANRCLKPKGRMVMIEPWVNPWSKLVYTYLHHEPFDDKAVEWSFPPQGHLSGANGALAWLIFERDVKQFRGEFPNLRIRMIKPMMPFCYLLSGGISLHNLVPSWSYSFWRWLEKHSPENKIGMFALIVLEKQ
ncbi:MAG: methyltransferase domain-containing protein [Chloroflexota bacterium]